MTNINSILLTTLVVVDNVVTVVVEDDAVLQYLSNRGAFVLIGSLQHLDRSLGISCHATGEEVSAGTETELGRTERILDRAVRTRLGDEATG